MVYLSFRFFHFWMLLLTVLMGTALLRVAPCSTFLLVIRLPGEMKGAMGWLCQNCAVTLFRVAHRACDSSRIWDSAGNLSARATV